MGWPDEKGWILLLRSLGRWLHGLKAHAKDTGDSKEMFSICYLGNDPFMNEIMRYYALRPKMGPGRGSPDSS